MPASSDPTSFSYGTPAGPDTGDLTGATSTNSLGGIFNSGSTSALQTLSIVITNILIIIIIMLFTFVCITIDSLGYYICYMS